MQRRTVIAFAGLAVSPWARAHHGWGGFDQERPLYLEGTARKVAWRNPHVEFELELPAGLKLPADLAQRSLPRQSAQVDGQRLLASAALPKRKDTRWHIELAPLTRMQAWQVPEIQAGEPVAVLGYAAPNEAGEAVLRAEYVFVGGKAYGLRSAPVTG